MRKTILFLISIILIFGFYSSCSSKKEELKLQTSASAEKLFEEGFKLFQKKKYEKARYYFRQAYELYPSSSYAPEAKFYVGMTYYKEKGSSNYEIAAGEFREFIAMYPSHPLAPKALYYSGMCYYKRMLSPGRDQENTKLAMKEFERLIKMYPLTPEAKEAKKLYRKCRDNLAEHIFLIAKLYYKIKAYKASIRRLKQILEKYPDFSQIDKIYYYLGMAYIKKNEYKKGIQYLEIAEKDFPHKKWGYKAKKYLKKHRKKLESLIKKEEENVEKGKGN